MDQLLGFAPDVDPTTPGIFTDCINIIPYEAGFQGAPTGANASVPVLSSDCRGAAVLQQLDDTRRIIIGTQTKLYELSGSAYVDRSTMAAPVQSAAVPHTTGGTLGAATLYYVVTALGITGETLASNEQSAVTTGGTASVTLSWAAVPGATGYKIYKSTTPGAENIMQAVGNVLTFLDTGAGFTSGTPYPTVSTASGGSYVGSVDSRWSLAQFGNTSIASNLADPMQASTTGVFNPIAGAPKAKIVVSASNNFVIAFNTSDPTFGVTTDRWWCCAQNDQTTWTPNVATGATTGRIIAMPGSITAALPLGDYVICYKLRGVFLGTFVGAQNGAWQWTNVPASQQSGCVGPEAVCDIGGAHFYCGDDDFWIFDGSSAPVSIGDEIRNWFKANSSETYRYRTICTFDRGRNLVWINYCSTSSTGVRDRTLVYHTKRKVGKWGKADVVLQASLNYIAGGVTINGLDAIASTIDTLPPVPFDSAYWQGGGRVYAYFNGSNQLVVNNGACGASGWTTGDFGDDETVTDLINYRPRFIQSPASSSATGLYRNDSGAASSVGPTEVRYDGRYDIRQAGKWHRIALSMIGDHKETAHKANLLPWGER